MTIRRARGFSLVEILLAVSLLGALLLAMSLFIFSMGEIWGRNSEQRLFDQHVRAVTRHVEELLRTAALAPSTSGTTASRPIAPQDIRLETGSTDSLLTFELPAGDRVLPWPGDPLPDVVCSLAVEEGKGLLLYWHSKLETRFTDDPPRALVLTPFGAALGYEYYQTDSKTWLSQTRLQKDSGGNWLVPDRLTLRFVHGKMTAETTVALVAPTDALPSF
jgi:prepilin-type N-terminal cleavage/methylation domain-containing protein